MEHTKQLLLLSVGLCLALYYVDAAAPVRVFAKGFFNIDIDETERMSFLRQKQTALQKLLPDLRGLEKQFTEHELQQVKAHLAQLEATTKVPYEDYVASQTAERQAFERKMAQLRTQLADAENRRLQAIDQLKLQQQKNGAEVATYVAALKEATNDRNKITSEYAQFTKAYYEQEEKMKKERDEFLKEKHNLHRLLARATDKHAKVLDALTATPTEGYKTIQIPEQDEIDKLREDITAFNGMADRKKLKAGLETTNAKLQELLNKLYNAGSFSSDTARGDLESAVGEMEKNTVQKREEQTAQRKKLLEKLKKENLANYDEGKIASLKKANDEMVASDLLQKEVARRSAYLKGIVEVSELMKECSNAIRDANERNLANLWAEKIQEVADSPLGKLWAQGLQDARDSELAKAWANAMTEAKNSKLALAWTNAIQDARDINLSVVWNDAVQNIKGFFS